MKPRLESDQGFNTPAEMLGRAVFLATLAALAVGILLTILGLVVWQPVWSLVGLGVVGLACVARAWLQRRGTWEQAERALDHMAWSDDTLESARAAELMGLLERWEAMEQTRGTPEFDPWALQALRNEIRAVVESDPALQALFKRLQQA